MEVRVGRCARSLSAKVFNTPPGRKVAGSGHPTHALLSLRVPDRPPPARGVVIHPHPYALTRPTFSSVADSK